MVRIISCIVLAATLFGTLGIQGVSQGKNKPGRIKDNNIIAPDECFSKGGLGIVNTNLYIVVKSARNELSLSAGKTWTGQNAPTPEVVFFFENRIWSPQVLPDGFDLSKAVVISFERNKIRFFDFGKRSGGFYRRIEQN